MCASFGKSSRAGPPTGLDITLVHEGTGEVLGPRRIPDPARAIASGERFVVRVPDAWADAEALVLVDAVASVVIGSGDKRAGLVLGSTVPVEVTLGPPRVVEPDPDGGMPDAGPMPDGGAGPESDAGLDDAGGVVDAGPVDGGGGMLLDGGLVDGGLVDGGAFDAGVVDGGLVDGGLEVPNWVAHWALDGNLVDEGGRYPGTCNNQAYEPGPRGQALSTWMPDVECSLGPIDELNDTPGLSVSLWFRTVQNGHGRLFRAGATDPELVVWQGDGTLAFQIDEQGDDAEAIWPEHEVESLDGRWHHGLFVFDGSADEGDRLRIYVDGAVRPTQVTGTVPTMTLSDLGATVYLGGEGSSAFEGAIDDVHLYDHALGPQDALTLMALGQPPPAPLPPGPVYSWSFDDDVNADVGGLLGLLIDDAERHAGVQGDAVALVSPNDFADLGNPSALAGLTHFTMAFWMRNRSLSHEGWIVLASDSTAGVGVSFDDAETLSVQIGNGRISDPTFNQVAPPGEWHHITVLFEAGVLELAVDGQLRSTLSSGVVPPNLGPTFSGGLLIGSFGTHFHGEIDELYMFDRTLSVPELSGFLDQAGGVPAGLPAAAHHYPFDGDASDVVGPLEGTLSGAGHFVPGVSGLGLGQQVASNVEVVLPGPPSGISQSEQFSISLWFVENAPAADQTLFEVVAPPADAVRLDLTSGGNLAFHVDDGELSGVDVPNFRAEAPPLRGNHLVATFAGFGDDRGKVFLNGRRQNANPVGAAFPTTTPDFSGRVAVMSALEAPMQNGPLDEVRFFARALDRLEVVALFERDRPRIPDDWLASWGWEFFHAERDGNYVSIPSGQVTFVNGPQGGALDLGGGSTTVELGRLTPLDTGSALSISIWLRHDTASAPDFQHLFSGYNNDTDDVRFGLNPSGELFFDLSLGGSDFSTSAPGFGAALDDFGWHHLVVVYDGSMPVALDRAWFWLDGQRQFFTNGGLASTFGNTGLNYFIGEDGVGETWPGGVDELYIYERALTPGEVQALFENGEP